MTSENKDPSPLAIVVSDAMMALHCAGVEVSEYALNARNAVIAFMDGTLDENKKLMVMDAGRVNRMLMELAATGDRVKEIHAEMREIGLKRGIPMPYTASEYAPDYLSMIQETVAVRLAVGVARR